MYFLVNFEKMETFNHYILGTFDTSLFLDVSPFLGINLLHYFHCNIVWKIVTNGVGKHTQYTQ